MAVPTLIGTGAPAWIAAATSRRSIRAGQSDRTNKSALHFGHGTLAPLCPIPAGTEELPLDYCWLTEKAQARPAGDKSWGAFATESISKGETVAAFGGWVVTLAQLEQMTLDLQHRSIQINADLCLVSDEMPEPGDMFNYSCESNCGRAGTQPLVAMRDIAPGGEINFDYALGDLSYCHEFRCLCGVGTCRGVVTGSNGRNQELQAKYDRWISPYLVSRIAALLQRQPVAWERAPRRLHRASPRLRRGRRSPRWLRR
ncbi:MAG: SET domain-containing protein [Actinobacteria bacterium]|nr:SET domain-containing protein [Actinomycetota bacterium]